MLTQNYWDKVFEGNPGYYGDVDNPSRIEITKYIASNDTVLDLGCGIGTLKAILPETNKYTGLDYSPRAVRIACKRWGDATFIAADARQLSTLYKDNEFDVVVMRHFLENQEDWREVIRQAFRIANKKVIINIRRPFHFEGDSRLVEQKEDTWVWDINYYQFNDVCRSLSTNVSFGKIQEEEFIIIGKHLDEVVFDLDDFHDNNHNLSLLLEAKSKWPKLKVTLFCIPALCTKEFIQDCKDKYGEWMEFAVHGFYHDTPEHGIATESNHWTHEEANKYLQMAEDMGVFVKGFRPPGWQINIETYEVLRDRGYWIADHRAHDRWEDTIKLPRYTTGNLREVHGHVQNVNGNGLEELLTNKCNFSDQTEFFFVSEALDTDWYLPNVYQ